MWVDFVLRWFLFREVNSNVFIIAFVFLFNFTPVALNILCDLIIRQIFSRENIHEQKWAPKQLKNKRLFDYFSEISNENRNVCDMNNERKKIKLR